MPRNWSIREFKKGDEIAILDLFKVVFHSEKSLEHWRWEYLNNPAGKPYIVLAEADNKIVGHFALVPRRMKINKDDHLGVLSLDTMVHPDFRRQGMHVVLGNKACELASKDKIQIAYGFSNGQSHQNAIDKIGFSCFRGEGIPLWVNPLNKYKVIKAHFISNDFLAKLVGSFAGIGIELLSHKSNAHSSFIVKQSYHLDQRFDRLWNDFSQDHLILVKRDIQYYNWRYLEHPEKSYTLFTAEKNENLVGIVVVKCGQEVGLKTGFIVDILTDRHLPDVAKALIFTAENYFLEQQMDIVGCLMLPSSGYSSILRESGFIKTPKWLLPQKMYLDVNAHMSRYPASFLLNPHNWHITWSDHDVV